MKDKICLLNPGPVTLTEGVRHAMLGPDICHREPAFSELMSDVRKRLADVYRQDEDQYASVLLTGSGTSAVEAMVDSLVPRNRPALVCANGIYGERIARMLEVHGKPPVVVRSDWTDPIDMLAVEQALQLNPNISYVIPVQHETTTGRMNDLSTLASVCKPHGTPMLVDAVSSFGGTEISLDAWNIAACAATANKCLHGVPGIAVVVAKRSLLAESHANSLYLDLATNFSAQEAGYPAFTPAIQSLYGLQQSLIEFEDAGGWQARERKYQELSIRLKESMQGLAPLLLADKHSNILTSFRLPEDVSFDELYNKLRRENFVIYSGQKHLEDEIFRISVMGDLQEGDFDRLAECMRSVFVE